jgi:hypothetical protein
LAESPDRSQIQQIILEGLNFRKPVKCQEPPRENHDTSYASHAKVASLGKVSAYYPGHGFEEKKQ